MRIKINQRDLLQMLYITQGVSEVIEVKPILSHLLFSASKESLSLVATGLDIAISLERKAKEGFLEIGEEGGIALPAKRLYELVKELPDGVIDIKTKENFWAEIHYPSLGQKKMNLVQLMGLNPAEYPKIPTFESDAEELNLNSKSLINMVEKTIFATSKDERRQYLQGIYFCSAMEDKEKQEVGIKMVATDGHRLAMINGKAEGKGGGKVLKKGVILPKKGIQEVRRIVGYIEGLKEGEAETVKMNILPNLGRIQVGNDAIFIRFIEGEYPDYNAVIPKEERNQVKVLKENLVKSLRRATVLSTREIQGLKIKMEKGTLIVHSQHPDTGEIREEIPVEYKGKNIEMNFNSRYLSEGLESFNDDTVTLDFGDDLSPLVISGKEEKEHLVLIMPLRND
jgi:DNA polymerase III subunit beta